MIFIKTRLNITLVLILSLAVSSTSFSDTSKEARMNEISEEIRNTNYSTKDIENLKEYIATFLTWKVKENKKAYMMFIDYPYQNPFKPVDYLSLTVIKEKGHKQPIVFSISCASMIDEKKGISIYFGKTGANKNKIKMSKTKLEDMDFNEVNGDYLKISFSNMKKLEINLFEEFMNNDHLFIDITGKNGTKYEIGYPLFKFQEQYKNLN